MSRSNVSFSGLVASRTFSVIAGLFALSLVVVAPARAAITLTAAGVAQGLKLTTFSTGFTPVQNVGPLGIGFTNTGGVLVSDKIGDIHLFPSDVDGQVAPAGSQHYGTVTMGTSILTNSAAIAQIGGNIYMARQGVGDIVQLNQNGSLNQVIATGLPFATGLVANPVNGHLYVSTLGLNSVYEIDPIAKTKTQLTAISEDIDGLALSADGSTLFTLNEDTGQVTGYNTVTKAITFAPLFVSNQIDGAVEGRGVLLGNLFVNTRDGKIIEVNLATRAQTTIADGGSRGDFASFDPSNSTVLFTQSDSIVRLSLASVTAVPLPPGIWAGAFTALGGVVISRRATRKRAQKAAK